MKRRVYTVLHHERSCMGALDSPNKNMVAFDACALF